MKDYPTRLRYVAVGKAEMLHLLQSVGKTLDTFALDPPLPADAVLLDADYDFMRQSFILMIVSDEFPEIPDGGEIPWHTTLRVTVKEPDACTYANAEAK